MPVVTIHSDSVVTCFAFRGFPGGSDGKASACNVGDPGLIPGSGRSGVYMLSPTPNSVWYHLDEIFPVL